MLDELIQYLGAHPGVMTAIAVTALLAVVGLWYVVSHHLQAIMITLLTAAGIGSGLLVLYRGFSAEMIFRRCPKCGATNVVKDGWFECAVCRAELPSEWNYGGPAAA